uniref:Deoxyribonuclease-2-alpha n=1 Tax=Parastrongyloides trichosuri TaxID=131310 RepID=A0A0N4ZCJ7_PARTI
MIITSFLLVSVSLINADLTCKDQNGNPVDFFMSYKLPKDSKNKEIQGIKEGFAFFYLDGNVKSLMPSKHDLRDENQAIAHTLNQIYKAKNNLTMARVMWNDELPHSAEHHDESKEKSDEKDKTKESKTKKPSISNKVFKIINKKVSEVKKIAKREAERKTVAKKPTVKKLSSKKESTKKTLSKKKSNEVIDKDSSDKNKTSGINSSKYAHAKGTLAFDKESGFYLIHSIPGFPPVSNYSYPNSGTNYGQSILCITVKFSQVDEIAKQLYFDRPQVYNGYLPTSLVSKVPYFSKVLAGEYQKDKSKTSSVTEIKSRNNVVFKSFAKTAAFKNDLYDGLVAPTLKTGLIVETWRRGKEVELNCSVEHPISDVRTFSVIKTSTFTYTQDHSKLAISADKNKPYVCIGDINRMTTQYTRGGGTTCLMDIYIWKQYYSIPKNITSCDTNGNN